MRFIYNIGIFLAGIALKIGALFNNKLKKGVEGRKSTFKILKDSISENDKTLWFHCASLGEYEQGLPVFTKLRNHYKSHKIVLSFFSPSGYDIKKNSPIADLVVYIPLDTRTNAKRFLNLVKPELSVFVKYDIWPNFLYELKSQQKRALLISASFRENQIYFKTYGGFFRKALFTFEHIFTQNEVSKEILNAINYKTVSVNGDTRFDRVYSQLETDNTLPYVEAFKNNKLCVVAGSTWPEGESLFIDFINSEASKDIKYIIAPHDIKPDRIKKLQESIKSKSILFSDKNNKNLSDYKVFIIDTIGILSKIYSYADIAYVGGAMGNTGLHNTLEPAVFGVPIIIGNNHYKFPEASALITNGGMFSISNQQEFNQILNELILNEEKRKISGIKNRQYIEKNTGAVIQILDYLRI
ncbi:3-deoxy-D-manno-octulosonic acid transferase [Algibacter luteus]|uniref:3-deoxy-D-manno-octulosonic acid transferase n=1 Tax=Algibacter luteus TaxID=1178825 RepID=UPI0025966485|nr:glycosyltransferase N-terminal domain-containing protein [Algibacter luteus]WJJ96721.1 glycosyltransferase N-terminal domain-containing protein [Algibacter luteus]